MSGAVGTGIWHHDDYDRLFHAGYQQFNSIVGTGDPDVSDFKAAGGKMLAYHGLAGDILF
jgi:hypothetical protein